MFSGILLSQVILAVYFNLVEATLKLPYPKSQTGPCPSTCVNGQCKEIAVTGKFYTFGVYGDCTRRCSSLEQSANGYGQCWGTGVYNTGSCEANLRNYECQCQKLIKTTECYEEGKVVDGEWASWSKWTKCSKVCGGGTQSRWRLCTNPSPEYGGEFCHGPERQEQNCNSKSCGGCRSDILSDCPSWIPQHNTAGEGQDVMTLKSSILNIIEMDHFGKCVKNIETNECMRVPSSVSKWSYRPSCYKYITEESYNSVSDLQTMQEDYVTSGWKVGLDTEVKFPFGGSFSASAAAAGSNSDFSSKTRRQAANSHTEFQNLELNCKLYEFALTGGNLPLTKDFSNSLKLLSANLTLTSLRDYEQFLGDFGTHYLDKLVLGGKIKSLTAILQQDLKQYSMSSSDAKDCLKMEAKARLGLSPVKLIDVNVGVSAEYNKCARKSSTTKQYLYTSSFVSKRTVEIRGGSLDVQKDLLFSQETEINYNRWLADIKYYPGVYQYSMSPVFSLVRKIALEQNDGQRPQEYDDLEKKAENLRKVTIRYISGKINETDCAILDEKPNWCSAATSRLLNVGLLFATTVLHILIIA